MSKSSEAVKRWRARTKERIVLGFGGPTCCVCGMEHHPAVLDFHHIDPSKKEFSFGSIRSGCVAWAKIVLEMEKCVQVCSNCHRLVHAGIAVVPEHAAKFDPEAAKPPKKPNSPCPVCGVPCRGKYCSRECQAKGNRKVASPPTKQELSDLLKTSSFEMVGRIYGVSGNSVRKWAAKAGLR